MLVVSMPTYRTPRELLDRAIDSVLQQTHRGLRLVVVNDGGEPLRRLPRSKRLVVYTLPRNYGRYFADAVVTRAIAVEPDWVWSVHDADDWSERDRYANLLPHMHEGAVMSSYWRDRSQRGKRTKILQQPVRDRLLNPRPGFTHIGHWVAGLYTSERVQRAGGIHPGFRVGFDTQFVRMVAMTGPINVVDMPQYWWCRRNAGSLTTSPDTRFGSPHRVAAKKRLMALDEKAWNTPDDPGSVIRDDIDPAVADEVDHHAAMLAARLIP